MSELYERIELMCKRHKVNVTQMAKDAGISRACLCDLKHGRTKSLSVATIVKLSRYFGLPSGYWIDGLEVIHE